MTSFLAASREGSSWQEQLPPLYIHSATGHPLSLHHSAQQRPMWGPSMRGGRGYDHLGRYYGLHKGRMGQQQLLLGAAAAAAGVPGEVLRQQSGSGSGSDVYGSLSYSQAIESESADNSSAMLLEEVTSSAAGTTADEEGLASGEEEELLAGKRRKQLQGAPAESSEQQVVPSASAGHGARGSGQQYKGQYMRQYRAARGGDLAPGADADMDMDDDDDEAGFGGGYNGPAVSLTTECSRFKGPGKAVDRAGSWGGPGCSVVEEGQGEADSAGEDDVMQHVEDEGGAQAVLLVAEAARLQGLQLGRQQAE